MNELYARELWKQSKKFRDMIILATLEKENKPMTAYELALFFINHSSYTPIIRSSFKRLEKEGYVIQRKEGNKKPYEMTQEGKDALCEYKRILTNFMKYVNSVN